MSFDIIADQPIAVRALQSAINKDRVAHAYLFIGPSGVGRKLTANVFARALNCENPRHNDPCGKCSSCRLIGTAKHPDVRMIMPTKRSSTITVEQIEDLLPFAYMRPVKGKFKVFLISEADRLGGGTANKLLKTLEEPPPFTVFVLVTEKPEGVLPTIASRCQPIKFARLRAESVARILESDFQIDRQRAEVAAELAGGQVTRGLKFADPGRMDTVLNVADSLHSMTARFEAYDRLMGFFAERRDELDQEADQNISNAGEELSSTIKASIEDLRKSYIDRHYREFLGDCMGLLLTFYRDALVLKETGAEELVINRNKIKTIRAHAGALSVPALMQNMEEIERASEFCSHYVGEDRVFLNLLMKLRNK